MFRKWFPPFLLTHHQIYFVKKVRNLQWKEASKHQQDKQSCTWVPRTAVKLIWNRTGAFRFAAPTGCTSACLWALIKTQRAQLIQQFPLLCTPPQPPCRFLLHPLVLKANRVSDLLRDEAPTCRGAPDWGFYFEGRGACMSTTFALEKQTSERKTVEEPEAQRLWTLLKKKCNFF